MTRSADEVEPPPEMLRATSSIGQEFRACQIRFGAAPSKRDRRRPATGRGRRSTARGPTASTPTRQLASTRASSTLTSNAIPAATPTASQALSEADRSDRPDQEQQHQRGQGQVEGGDREEVRRRPAGTSWLATIKAVTTWARRDAPISRAVNEASRIVATPASAGNSRKRVRLPPTSVVPARGQQRYQDRIVRLGPGRVMPALDEVELVAVEPVPVGHQHPERERGCSDDENASRKESSHDVLPARPGRRQNSTDLIVCTPFDGSPHPYGA